MRNTQDVARDLTQDNILQQRLKRILAILNDSDEPSLEIRKKGGQFKLIDNTAQRLVSKALLKRFKYPIFEQTDERTILDLGGDLGSVFIQLLQMELEQVLISAQNHDYFLRHLTRRHPHTGTGTREAAFSASLYREGKSEKLIPYSIEMLSCDDGVNIQVSSGASGLVKKYLEQSLLIPKDCFEQQNEVLKICYQPQQLLEQIERLRINAYSVCVLNEKGSLVFPEFQKEYWDGSARYTVSEGICQDPYHPEQSLYSRLMHDFGIEIRDPRARNFIRIPATGNRVVFLLEGGDWFLRNGAIKKAKRSYPNRQDIPQAALDYLRFEQGELQETIRKRGYEDAIVKIEFMAFPERFDSFELEEERPENPFGKIYLTRVPGLYEQIKGNGITMTPDVENEGFTIGGIEPAALGKTLFGSEMNIDLMENNPYFYDLTLPNNTSLLQHLRQLSKELDQEPIKKRLAIADKTRVILKDYSEVLERLKENPPAQSAQFVVDFIEKVKQYESELSGLSVRQKLLIAACSVIGTALGVLIGAAAGLALGLLFGSGVGSVAPVFGTIGGAIAAGSISGVLLAIKGAGVGAMIGTAAGAFLGGLGIGGGGSVLVHRGLFSNSQKTVSKIAAELIESLKNNQANTSEKPDSPDCSRQAP